MPNMLDTAIFAARSCDQADTPYVWGHPVYFERFEDIRDAIQREHNIKHWSRAWKVRMIVVDHPNWDDLCPTIAQ